MTSKSPRWNILVVDDSLADVYLLRLALEQADIDFQMTALQDGAEALAYVRHQGEYADAPRPDLAVLDLSLPKHDADEILKAIRSAEDMQAVPAVVLTSCASAQTVEKVRAMGIARSIIKPSNLNDYLHIGTTLKEILLGSPAQADVGIHTCGPGPQ